MGALAATLGVRCEPPWPGQSANAPTVKSPSSSSAEHKWARDRVEAYDDAVLNNPDMGR